MIQLVFATNICGNTGKSGFGYKNGLPWGYCSKDLANFKKETLSTSLIMGYNTFKSLPKKLDLREHLVICDPERTEELPSCGDNGKPDMTVANLTVALSLNRSAYSIIGGPNLLLEALPYADRILHTKIIEKKLSPADKFLYLDLDGFKIEKRTFLYNHKEQNIKGVIIEEWLKK